MHEKVRDFIESKRVIAEETRKRAKNRHLINLGLYEREYIEGGFSNEYTEYDADTGKYYKKIAIQVSDEDYEELCSLADVEKEDIKNPIAQTLTIFGWVVIIGGFIGGITLGAVSSPGYENDFMWSVALALWVRAFVVGIISLGFAEIIKLLHKLTIQGDRKHR